MANEDLERLVVQLSADVKKYENAMNRATGAANKNAKLIENRFKSMNKDVSRNMEQMARKTTSVFDGLASRSASSMGRFARASVAGIVGGLTVSKFQELSDAATKIDNSLKVAGLSGKELDLVYESLSRSATKNAAPLETLATLYGRVALVQNELGISQEQLLGFTDKIAMALRVQGGDAQAASGALLQLGQALGSGTVRAEEFSSMQEGALPILQSVAAGLQEAGGSVAKLRQLVIDGKLSSEAFFKAFEVGSSLLEGKVAGAVLTSAQAHENLQTALIDLVRDFNKSTKAGEAWGRTVDSLAKTIADFDVAGFIDKINNAYSALERFMNAAGNAEVFKSLNRAMGLTDENDIAFNLDTRAAEEELKVAQIRVEQLQDRIELNTELGLDNKDALANLAEVQARVDQLKASIPGMAVLADQSFKDFKSNSAKQFGPGMPLTLGADVADDAVSLKDFSTPGKPGKGSGGGSRKSKEPRENDFEREKKQLQERLDMLRIEAEVLRVTNPLIDDYGFAMDRARTEHELLNAATKAGIELTPALKQEIAGMAEQYALATTQIEKMQEAQDEARRKSEDALEFQKDFSRGIVDGFMSGKTAAEQFADAISKLGNRLMDLAFDSFFDSKKGGSGILGSIGKLFGFADGGYTGSGGKYEPAGVVHKGEYVFDKKAVERLGVGNLEALRKGYANGGPVGASIPSLQRASSSNSISAPVNIQIDARGADREGLARLNIEIASLKKELPARIDQRISTSRDRNLRFK